MTDNNAQPIDVEKEDEGTTNEEENHCIICLGPSTTPTHLSCTCVFECCMDCIVKWMMITNETKCPLCTRTDVKLLTSQNVDVCQQQLDRATELMGVWHSLSPDDPSFKDVLKEASGAFLHSIVCDRANPGGYVGMAYIQLLLGCERQAFKYVDYVLSNIDETNSDSLKFMSHIESSSGPNAREKFAELDRLEAE